MFNVSFAGRNFELPNYEDSSINFSDVYKKLRKWHVEVRPIFDETVKDIGSTIDDVRIATKQLEANAGRLSEEELETYAKQCRVFTESFTKFKSTQTHAHLLLKNLGDGITFLNRPGLTKTDIITLEHLDPQQKENVEKLQATCNKYLEDLRKIHSSVTANCQHFDKRISDLSRPLDYHLKAVESKGQLGYLSWGWTHLKHIFFNPTIDTVTSSSSSEPLTLTPTIEGSEMDAFAAQTITSIVQAPSIEIDAKAPTKEESMSSPSPVSEKSLDKEMATTTALMQSASIIEEHMSPKSTNEERENVVLSIDTNGLTRRGKKGQKTVFNR